MTAASITLFFCWQRWQSRWLTINCPELVDWQIDIIGTNYISLGFTYVRRMSDFIIACLNLSQLLVRVGLLKFDARL